MGRVTFKSFFECFVLTKTKIQANHQAIKYIIHIIYIHVLSHIKKRHCASIKNGMTLNALVWKCMAFSHAC